MKSELVKGIGRMVRDYRQNHGHTLSHMAARLGISLIEASKLERGRCCILLDTELDALRDSLHDLLRNAWQEGFDAESRSDAENSDVFLRVDQLLSGGYPEEEGEG